ncbi:hypothetical protein CVV26_01420 [Candidatus Kuenenbacteria bacterium HGW-Kuenenbacteria-1]|uniref:DUF3784 domain-containing protein n=1 Tax=Candidatus Kuenenbacteria bacterium HGW-Kuenenbacteria-1 TaxID=2013812 RepID=A0A2N1UNP4_9BACT|nr:MAG: hypothetical protein CVV26_01420 [Candidatus Kuenenbacteria bacterium HGW-Kuenenbacteria-1]
MFWSIVIGLLILVFGSLLVIKTEWFLQIVGRVDWAEKWLGVEGGTRLYYKLLGILFCIIGFLTMTGLLKSIVLNLVEPFFGGFR